MRLSIYAEGFEGGAVTTEQAQAEDCPLCQAAKGDPCVAMTDKFEYEQPKWSRDWGAPKKLVRGKGTPLPGYCHPARRSAARERLRRADYQRARRESLRRLRGPSAGALAARAAMLAWDAAEYRALTTWWRENGHIFTDLAEGQ